MAKLRVAMEVQMAARGMFVRARLRVLHAAAIRMQALWRGHSTRQRVSLQSMEENRMSDIRQRLAQATRTATDSKRIGARTRAAVQALQTANKMPVLMSACHTLGTLPPCSCSLTRTRARF